MGTKHARDKSITKKRGFDKKGVNKARSPTAWNLKPSASQMEFEECLIPDKSGKEAVTKKKGANHGAPKKENNVMSENEL